MKNDIKDILNKLSLYNETPSNISEPTGNIEYIDDISENKKMLSYWITTNHIKKIDSMKFSNLIFDVYKTIKADADGCFYFYFINNDIIALRICGIKIKYENKTGIKFTATRRKSDAYHGIAKFIYTNYFLNKFDFIESDNAHRNSGKELWKKLLLWAVQNHKKAVVYSNNGGEFYQFSAIYEVNDNFDSFYPDSNCVFRIYR